MGWSEWMHTVEVEPSLYAADFSRLGEQVRTLLNAGARIFHFDVGDGHFVEPVTIGPIVLKDVAPIVHEVGGRMDCHLMVESPERHFGAIAQAGGDSVTFHVEAVDDLGRTLAAARQEGLQAGIAFSPGTELELAAEAATDADLVLCMSIEPGYSGQELMPGALERIAGLRKLLPHALIQVDGGIDAGNIRAVRDAGANLMVAGSSVFSNGDLPHAYLRLLRALA